MPGLRSLPVLMHHYISRYPNTIAVSPELFRAQCKGLAEAGWRGVGLDEAEAFLARGVPLPARSCLITFDDGYLDNYVHAWPILAEYGHQGTIFAVTERIDEASRLRPSSGQAGDTNAVLPDVDHPASDTPMGFTERRDAFFTWAEARRMEASGVMRIAAHSMRHQNVFIEDKFSGFYLPGPNNRTFDRPLGFCWGMPAFPRKAGLANRALVPTEEFTRAVTALVPQERDAAYAFSRDPEKMQQLARLAASMEGGRVRMESEAAMRERIHEELASGKAGLERELGHAVHTLCWPWGDYSGPALESARELGFTVFMTTAYGPNPPGEPLAVRRFKVRQKGAAWLLSRVRLFSRPILGALYAKCRI
jgi:peptidoglycan/xylan/chitin deacetylase (PgdA/CDA1 family)